MPHRSISSRVFQATTAYAWPASRSPSLLRGETADRTAGLQTFNQIRPPPPGVRCPCSVARRSGRSSLGERPSRCGNKVRKCALFPFIGGHCQTPSHRLTVSERPNRACVTTKRSSCSHDDALKFCSPCCATAPFINIGHPRTPDDVTQQFLTPDRSTSESRSCWLNGSHTRLTSASSDSSRPYSTILQREMMAPIEIPLPQNIATLLLQAAQASRRTSPDCRK